MDGAQAEPEHPLGKGIPRRGEVRTWALDLDAPLEPELRARCEEALRPEELARAERFPHALGGRRWARAQAMLRVLLGDSLGIEPAAICFEQGAHGKPRLAHMRSRVRAWGEDLRFNVAHSGPVAVYALAAGMEVGVDVEARLRGVDASARRVDLLAVARRAFGASAAERLAALGPEQREREVLRLWVRHEAALKCSGVGLAGTQRADIERAEAGERPWVAELDLWGGAVAAVAAMEEPERLAFERVGRADAADRL